MTTTELVRLFFVGLTALGGGVGISKILSIKSTNKNLEAKTGKTGIEATAIFSESVLKMLQNAQRSAEKATRQAEHALKDAERCREELSFLRRWIIEQGLTPPVSGKGQV